MRTSEIFPFDVDFNSENEKYSTLSRDRVLRPEMIAQYEYQLKADSLKNHSSDKANSQAAASQLSRAGKHLKEDTIPRLVTLLNSLTVIPMDSEQLQNIFHMQGVNMRYLGEVAK